MKLKLYYYYSEIYAALEGNTKEKRGVLKMIKTNVESYMQEIPGCTFSDVRNYFGTPNAIATLYQPEVEHLETHRKNFRRILNMIFWTLCGLAVLFIIFFLSLYLIQQLAPSIPTYIK